MIEHSRRHSPGRFAKCPSCGREPQHVECWGGTSREPCNALSGGVGSRHQLHCTCRRSTALHPTLALAEAEWGLRMTQLAMPLAPPKPTRRKAA
jgi:hypothetical protein